MDKVSLAFVLLVLVPGAFLESPDVSFAFKSSEIVPDILDHTPKDLLQVSYPNGKKVNLGNEVTPTEAKDIPHLSWEADEKALYTVLMVDLDVPSRKEPTQREVRHWIVINIPGNKISEGQTIYEYIGSGPPREAGIHRYVFLVFKQSERILSKAFIDKTTLRGRMSTSTKKLITDYKLGNPVAGNFFLSQYDDYVPIFRKQFTGPK